MIVMAKQVQCSTCDAWKAIAGVKLLVEIAAFGTPIARLVVDDDSSLSANMKHSYRRVKIDANLMAETDWPCGPPTAKNSKGTKNLTMVCSH